MEYAQHIYELD